MSPLNSHPSPTAPSGSRFSPTVNTHPDKSTGSFSRRVTFLLASLCCLAGFGISLPNHASAAGKVDWSKIQPRDTSGGIIVIPNAKFTVVCFLGTECPLAKLYGPRLQKLADRFHEDAIAFLGVNSNLQDSPSEIDDYVKRCKIDFPVAKDSDQSIADQFQAARTPQVFVIDPTGLIRYSGRIDDQYEPGVARNEPKSHDLADALSALLAGKEPPNTTTQGVGCLITRRPKLSPDADPKSAVTFHRDVAALLNKHCVECHREGEIGPMALTDYDEVVGWGDMILEVIDEKRMPPWHADPSIGHFVGERLMPDGVRDTIAKWIEGGMMEGDEADRPKQPRFAESWHLPTAPDIEFEMRDRPFTVPAEGTVEYQYFVVDPKWDTDQWVRAAQVIPGERSVVHHCIIFVRPPDDVGFDGIGWLGAYVPGQRTVNLPPGHARLVPAGSKLVFQMHYTPNGTETVDRTRVGVWRVPADQVTHKVRTHVAIEHEFEIPPRESDYQVKMLEPNAWPPGGRMLGITPHMHLRGKSFRLTRIGKDGSRKPLLSVPRYDFNWQHWYEFAEPVDLEQTESLEMSVVFDNSSDNPFNPSAEEYVSWGDQTWEEMAVAFYDVATPIDAPAWRIRRTKPTAEEIATYERRVAKHADEFLEKMDQDGNGSVEWKETTRTFQRFGFRQLDQNGDQVLDRQEIEARARADVQVTGRR